MRATLWAAITLLALATGSAIQADDDCRLDVVIMETGGAEARYSLWVVAGAEGTADSQRIDTETGRARFEGLPCGRRIHVATGSGNRLAYGITSTDAKGAVLRLTVPKLVEIRVRFVDGADRVSRSGRARFEWVQQAEEAFILRGRELDGTWFASPEDDGGSTRIFLPQGTYVVEGIEWPIRSARLDGKAASLPLFVEVGSAPRSVELVGPTSYAFLVQVIDENGGRVPDVSLKLEMDRTKLLGLGYFHTGPDGETWVTSDKPKGRVRVSKRGWTFEPSTLDLSSESSRPIVVRGRPEADRLRGRLIDDRGGKPLPNMFVFYAPKTSCDLVDKRAMAMTDKQGRFELECCPSEAKIGSALGRVRNSRVGRESCGNDAEPEFSVVFSKEDREVLAKGAMSETRQDNVLEGSVLTQAREPLPEIPLWLMLHEHLPSHWSGETDSEGRFRFEGLPPGDYSLQVDPDRATADQLAWILTIDGSHPGYREMLSLEDRAAPTKRDLQAVEAGSFCLPAADREERPLAVSGLDVHRPGEWNLITGRHTEHAQQRREPALICSPPLAPGPYQIKLSGPEFHPTWWPGVYRQEEAESITVEPGKRLELPAVKAPRLYSVRLVLKGWDTVFRPDVRLRPAEDAAASWFHLERDLVEEPDDRGLMRAKLPEGDWELLVTSRYSEKNWHLARLRVGKGEPATTIELQQKE